MVFLLCFFFNKPKAVLTYLLYVQPDVASIEEWFVNFMMHYGLNKFTTKGTLLDTLRGKNHLQR